MSAPERVRIGVLGCGPISQFAHFEACRRAPSAELYAICDVAPNLLERMAAVHQPAVTYQDYDELLTDPNVDAVIVAIADDFHVEACERALAARKHVLVEKPLGVTVEECERLQERVRESGLLVQIGNMKRFDPGIAFAHEFIREELGELLALKAWYCDSTYRYTMTDNLQPIPVVGDKVRRPPGDPKADRRRYFLLTHASHLVDTARFLGGPIVAVRAELVTKFDAYCWFVSVEFENGALGHLDLTIAVRMDFHEGFQVYGEYGSVVGKTYLPWFFKSSDVECFSVRDGQYRRPLGADAHFYKLQLEAFASAVLRGDSTAPGATIDDGVAALRTLAAIGRSVEDGERILLADVVGGPE
jgi:predicted dehydrogenase